jgi:hypothetical protein
MDKKEKLKKQKDAYQAYLTGESRDKTCKKLKISHQTYDNWKNTQNWKADLDKQEAAIRQDIGVDVLAEKKRSLQIYKAVESLFIKQVTEIYPKMIENGEIAIKPNEFAKIQDNKWSVLIPRTISQYNLMKQENSFQLKNQDLLLEYLKEKENAR